MRPSRDPREVAQALDRLGAGDEDRGYEHEDEERLGRGRHAPVHQEEIPGDHQRERDE